MTATTLPALDGNRAPFNVRADQNVDGSYAIRSSLEVGGVAVSTANPVPMRLAAVPVSATPSLASSLIIKSGACSLYGIQALPTLTGYVMLVDANSVQADGAIAPKKVWYFSASNGAAIDKQFDPPLQMNNGAVLFFSVTGPFTLTSSNTAFLSGEAT